MDGYWVAEERVASVHDADYYMGVAMSLYGIEDDDEFRDVEKQCISGSGEDGMNYELLCQQR